MKKLQGSKFVVILTDALGPCGELLTELLKTPLVYSLHFCPGYTYKKDSGGASTPPFLWACASVRGTGCVTRGRRARHLTHPLPVCFLCSSASSVSGGEELWDPFLPAL